MKALLIPSATLIPSGMRSKMGAIPTCLFPLQNATMLERIFDKYHSSVDKVYVVVGREKNKVFDFISLKQLDVQTIEIDEIRDLGYTVWYGINAILEQQKTVEQIYINFGDTLLSNQPNANLLDVVYYAREAASKDWTFFKHENGVIYDVVDKGQAVPDTVRLGNVFPGVFEIAHPDALLNELNRALISSVAGVDSFYQAISRYSAGHPFDCILAEDWFDVGHSDRYAQAKTIVAARVFNSIEIDKDRGLLTKHSANQEKLIDEIKWYLKLPNQLQYLLPRIYNYSLDWSCPYVTMEYYGYNTLHEMLVYGNITELQWRKIFQRVRFIMEDMKRFQVNGEADKKENALETIYINKTISRLEKLRDNAHFSPLFRDEIIINGKRYLSLDEYIRRLPAVLKERLIANAPTFCIIHGDLCFSNILVENDFGFLRVVDPRGSFGDYDIYGDQRYEVAKLMHSIDGQYDFIIEDMVSTHINGNRIDLEKPSKPENVYLIFKDVFQDFLSDYQDLQLVESLLFLSMIPLHSDHLNRQYAMLATGLQLLDEAGAGG